jgi:hypothetical protein
MQKTEMGFKPDPVVDYHSSRPRITPRLERPTRLPRTDRPQTQAYLDLHRIEFT